MNELQTQIEEESLPTDDVWNEGYIAGYKAGYRDASNGNEYDHSPED